MERLEFNDYEEFACEVADTYDSLKGEDYEDIAIIAKYEEAKEIISELSCIGYSLESIRMSRPEWENYHEEYLISLNNDGIWCEPMKLDGKYLTDESTITYILDNCSSKVIPCCKGKNVYEVTVGIDEDDCDCDDCSECACKKDEKPTTTSSTSKSTYKINGKECSKEEFDAAMTEIEDKYLDNVRDMLLGYCEIMDRMNQWRSRLFW